MILHKIHDNKPNLSFVIRTGASNDYLFFEIRLAKVSLTMLLKIPIVDKILLTNVALGVPFGAVTFLMNQHIRPVRETPIAELTGKRLQGTVRQQVSLISRRVGKLLRAVFTLVGFFFGVNPGVHLQIVWRFESTSTHGTFELWFAIFRWIFVQLEMRLQITFANKCLQTDGTFEPLALLVNFLVVI